MPGFAVLAIYIIKVPTLILYIVVLEPVTSSKKNHAYACENKVKNQYNMCDVTQISDSIRENFGPYQIEELISDSRYIPF